MNRGWTILFLLLSFGAFSQQGYFVKNKGQLPDNVLFHAKLNYGNFYIEKDGSFKVKVLSPSQVDEVLGHHHNEDSHSNHKAGGHFPSNLIKGHSFKVQFINAKFIMKHDKKHYIKESHTGTVIDLGAEEKYDPLCWYCWHSC